jgi:hypothetical protein
LKEVCGDVRASVRALTKQPGFTVLVVLSLTVGIAADTAIFSVVNGVLLRPLPSPHDDRTSPCGTAPPQRGVEREETFTRQLLRLARAEMIVRTPRDGRAGGHLLIGDGEPEAIRSWVVSPAFFEALIA